MDNDVTIIQGLAETKTLCQENTKRISELSKQYELLHSLATSVEVLATQVKTLANDISEIKVSVNDLESKPAKNYDDIKQKVVISVITAFVTWVLRGILV